MSKEYHKISLKTLILLLLTVASLIPNIGISFSTAGFNWTFYRIAILICMVLYLQMPKKESLFSLDDNYCKWIMLMAIWVLYGTILLNVSEYSNFHSGFVELLSVFNGLICIAILGYSVRTKEDLDMLLEVVAWICIALTLFGLFEIETGFHPGFSEYNDNSVLKWDYLPKGKGATGNFYSVNDFSTFLACLSPTLLFGKKYRPVKLAGFIGVIYIAHVNDANICILAIAMALAVYAVVVKDYHMLDEKIIKALIFSVLSIATIVLFLNVTLLSEHSALFDVINTQIKNIELGRGSLWMRLTLYKESLIAAWDSMLFGLGPASFTNYFTAHRSVTNLVNPHNLYLEILTEYGLIIATGFVILLFGMIHRVGKNAVSCTDEKLKEMMVIGYVMLIIYSIVCISPSTFIGYAWQWVVIAIGIVLSGIPDEVG